MRLVSHLLALTLVTGGFALVSAGQQRTTEAEEINFQGMTFQLPRAGWKRTENGHQLTFTRRIQPQRAQSLSVWKVEVPQQLRTHTIGQHTSAYFDAERKQQRVPQEQWKGFREQVQKSGSREYPSMTFTMTWRDPATPVSVDGLYVLYFPSDFAQRQVFYCFMWRDLHASNEIPTTNDLEPLIAVLATVAPPPVPLVEAALSRLIDLAPESTSTISTNVANGRAEASRCVQATRLASTYSSRVLYKVTNGKPAVIQWRVDFSAPGKYHVLQSSGQVFDEWITIGKENYRNAGLWLKLATDKPLGQPELNRFFGVDKFLHILATAEPTSAIEYISQEAQYLLLEYRAQLGMDFNFTATEPGQVRIWIDRQTNLLVKGEVTARDSAHGTLSKLYLQQVFSGYGEAIRIEPPPSSVLGTNRK